MSASRFAELEPPKPTIAKPKGATHKTFVCEGQVYKFQKGEKKDQDSGNAGVVLGFDKYLNEYVKSKIAPVDLQQELKWNGADAYKMKIDNPAQLTKVLQKVEAIAQVRRNGHS